MPIIKFPFGQEEILLVVELQQIWPFKRAQAINSSNESNLGGHICKRMPLHPTPQASGIKPPLQAKAKKAAAKRVTTATKKAPLKNSCDQRQKRNSAKAGPKKPTKQKTQQRRPKLQRLINQKTI